MSDRAKERQRLVDANVSFVRSVAAKVKESLPREIEFDDLVAYGMQGLLEAADRFDARHGASFTTFAYYRVRGAIFDGLRGMGWLPRAEWSRIRFEERATQYLQNLADRDQAASAARAPTAQEGEPTEELRSLSSALDALATIFLTTLRADEAGPPSDEVSPEGQFESEERLRALRSAVHDLPDKERRLMELYYLEDRSLGDAAGVLGLSKSWASRLHTRAIELLRVALAKRGYEEASPPSAARAVAVAEVAVDARATAPPSSRRSLLGLRRDG